MFTITYRNTARRARPKPETLPAEGASLRAGMPVGNDHRAAPDGAGRQTPEQPQNSDQNKTKARTQAQRRAARRGRPRKDVPFREPNGRASRIEDPIDRLAAVVRAKMLGISEERARDQRAGSFLGYLAMLGRSDGLSAAQHEAALKFKELRNDYLRAIKAPNAVVDNKASGRPADTVNDDYIRWCANVTARYAAARKAIQEAQNATRSENLWAALDLVVIQEQPIFNLIGATRELCNTLAMHFRS